MEIFLHNGFKPMDIRIDNQLDYDTLMKALHYFIKHTVAPTGHRLNAQAMYGELYLAQNGQQPPEGTFGD